MCAGGAREDKAKKDKRETAEKMGEGEIEYFFRFCCVHN